MVAQSRAADAFCTLLYWYKSTNTDTRYMAQGRAQSRAANAQQGRGAGEGAQQGLAAHAHLGSPHKE